VREFIRSITIRGRLPVELRRLDWVGGYPFEVAKPEQIFDFSSNIFFIRMTTQAGLSVATSSSFENRPGSGKEVAPHLKLALGGKSCRLSTVPGPLPCLRSFPMPALAFLAA